MIPSNKIFLDTWKDIKKILPISAFQSGNIKILKENEDTIELVFKLDLYNDLPLTEKRENILYNWKSLYSELETTITEAINREVSNFLYASHPANSVKTSLKECSVSDYRKKLENYYNLGYFPGSLLTMFIDDFLK